MGLFDFLKKYKKEIVNTSVFVIDGKSLNSATKNDIDLEHLTAEGELPWGWHTHNKEFTSKINSEYSYFLNMWLDARKKSPKELHQALKSFILYLEDVEKLCKSKGECFEFWFYEILASKEYIAKRKEELNRLTTKLDKGGDAQKN
jgi:hypothetical protein